MKKLLIGCMAAVAALTVFSGCEQDKVTYGGANYLMTRFILMPCKKRTRYSTFPLLLLWQLTTTAPLLWK